MGSFSNWFKRTLLTFSLGLLLTLSFSVLPADAGVLESDTSRHSASNSKLSESGNTLVSVDVDGNGVFDPLTDGLLLLRWMFELRGDPLIAGVIAPNAEYTSSAEIDARILGLSNKLDVDNNGTIDALTDGLLILRYLFGITEEALIQGVVGAGSLRNTSTDIATYIDLLMLLDNDGDGVSNEEDAFPDDPTESVDTDLDGVGNNADSDDDGDGVNDDSDAFPLDPAETVDTDLDGVGNNADTDDDGDFQIDADELTCGSDPLDATSNSDDFDTDNSPDCVDTDDDNDGVLDIDDYYPFEPLLSEINCNLVFSPTYPQCLSDSISSSEFYSNGEDVVVLDWDGFSKIPGVIYELQGTNDDDVLIGTDGNDRIEGSADPFGRFEDGYDILIGGKGDDILIGGPNNSSVGGCIADIYRFDDDSGNDIILGFTLSLSGYSRCSVVDRIEIKQNINNSGIYTATDLINASSNNSDGFAVLNLSAGNTVTLHGVALDDLKLESIHVLTDTSELIQGTPDADVLNGTDGNDRIEGGSDPFGRFEDGYDILTGGKGDDVLIGGPNNSSVGGCIADIYRFDDDSGNDMILGFTLSLSGYSGCSVVDRIEIPAGINGTTITSATDVLSRITSNSDGWAIIDLGSSNSITLHGKSRDLITLGQITVL